MRTVLWDMDGTIADSEQLHFQAWQNSLDKYGVSYSFAQFIADFGRSNGELLPELLGVEPGSELVRQVSREKEAIFRRLAHEQGMRLLPGVGQWLERFRDAGVRQVVSSSGPMANIVVSVDILDIGDYFLALMSGATLARSKPDPAIFLNSAAAVQVEPRHCVVVEDSLHGIEGAQRAGMASIAVGKIASSHELARLIELNSGPECIPVDSMADISWAACEALWRQA